MTCELCGERLRVQADGLAHCTHCGMAYSLEYLREKSTGTKPAPSPKATSNNFDSQYRMARAAIRQGNTSEAVTICDEILTRDYEDLTAWEIKIRALCDKSDPYAPGKLGKAADCFREACESAKDQSARSMFIDRVKPVFMDHLYFNDKTPTVARNFADVDVKLAEEYLLAVFKAKKDDIRKSCQNAVDTVAEYRREANSDYRYYTFWAKEVDRCKKWMGSYADWADSIWTYCGQKCHIANQLHDFLCPIRDAKNKMGTTLDSVDWILNKIEAVFESQKKEAQRIATEKHWEANADLKAQLVQRLGELRQKLQQFQFDLITCENDPQPTQLTKKVNDLTAELGALGFFEFKKKKELREELAAAEHELRCLKQELSLRKEKITNKLRTVKRELQKIEQQLRDPLGFEKASPKK